MGTCDHRARTEPRSPDKSGAHSPMRRTQGGIKALPKPGCLAKATYTGCDVKAMSFFYLPQPQPQVPVSPPHSGGCFWSREFQSPGPKLQITKAGMEKRPRAPGKEGCPSQSVSELDSQKGGRESDKVKQILPPPLLGDLDGKSQPGKAACKRPCPPHRPEKKGIL